MLESLVDYQHAFSLKDDHLERLVVDVQMRAFFQRVENVERRFDQRHIASHSVCEAILMEETLPEEKNERILHAQKIESARFRVQIERTIRRDDRVADGEQQHDFEQGPIGIHSFRYDGVLVEMARPEQRVEGQREILVTSQVELAADEHRAQAAHQVDAVSDQRSARVDGQGSKARRVLQQYLDGFNRLTDEMHCSRRLRSQFDRQGGRFVQNVLYSTANALLVEDVNDIRKTIPLLRAQSRTIVFEKINRPRLEYLHGAHVGKKMAGGPYYRQTVSPGALRHEQLDFAGRSAMPRPSTNQVTLHSPCQTCLQPACRTICAAFSGDGTVISADTGQSILSSH